MAPDYRASVLAVRHEMRIAILDLLASGARVTPEEFAERRKLRPSTVRYHFAVLAEVEAIAPTDRGYTITEHGEALRALTRRGDRRQRDRRRGERRKG
jgi:DNA-binding transcriptional ArsR family regulator